MRQRGYRKGFYRIQDLFLRVEGVARSGNVLWLYVATPLTPTHATWVLEGYPASEIPGRFVPAHRVPRFIRTAWRRAQSPGDSHATPCH